ncbi:MAG TPA: lamin tail domain-containing protein [Burkholderiaceae bacterium]|jgi:hypothetical protein
MKKINFWMAGSAVTLLATLSGCGGGGDSGGDHPSPTLSATLPTAATAGTAVSITGITATNAQALTVDWGDGTQDAPATIPTTLTHTYAATATCVKAALCTIDVAALGWGPAAEQMGAVVLSLPPTLTATIPATGTAAVPYSITGIAAANGTALSVDWGDGVKETPAVSSTSLTHTYAAPGSYNVDLVLTGKGNTSAEKTASVTVGSAVPPTLTATLPTVGLVGSAITVTGVTTANGSALTVNWGDGVTETPALSLTSLSHTYGTAGGYSIGMTLAGLGNTTPDQKNGCITIVASGPLPELFISEYIEGTSSNKAIEIYNPTSCTVDLSAYSLEVYANGSNTPIAAATATLSGMLAPGKTYVLYNPSAIAALVSAISSNATIVFKEAAFPAQVTQYNGNDAVVLKKSGVVIDQVGVVGNDPGAAGWGGLTMDHDLRRKAGIVRGTPNLTSPWDPTVEWDIQAETSAGPFNGLGDR